MQNAASLDIFPPSGILKLHFAHQNKPRSRFIRAFREGIAMKRNCLLVYLENDYRRSSWCAEIYRGLAQEAARRQISIQEYVPGTPLSRESGPLIVLGGSRKCLEECLNKNIWMVSAGIEPQHPRSDVSYVTVDRRMAMRDVVRYLYRCGARRIALLGTDSTIYSDFLRFRGWADAVQELGIGNGVRGAFNTNDDLEQCFHALLDSLPEYDAVACTNDYIALKLLNKLKALGLSVPRDMMVTGFGGIALGEWTDPPLTTVTINGVEIGRQAFFTWLYLMRNETVRSLNVSVECRIIPRATTPPCDLPAPPVPTLERVELLDAHRTLLDPGVLDIARLERLFSAADETTLALLRGVAAQVPNEKLCETAFISYTAFKRRLKKIYQACHVESKQELAALINALIPGFCPRV